MMEGRGQLPPRIVYLQEEEEEEEDDDERNVQIVSRSVAPSKTFERRAFHTAVSHFWSIRQMYIAD